MSTVAVLGLNGFLGKHVIESLISEPFYSKLSHPIKLLTSSGKQPVESDKVEYIKFTVGDGSLSKALAGVDIVINLGGIPGSPLDEILVALKENNIKLYIPSQFGTDLIATEADFPGFLDLKTHHSAEARTLGDIKVIDLITGLFIDNDQTFLDSPVSILDLDKETNEIEIVGDLKEDTPINPSFFKDIGNAVAAIVTNPDFTNFPDLVHIYSDKVTLGDLVSNYEKSAGVKLTKKYTSTAEIVAEAKKKYENFSFDDFEFYLRTLIAQGDGKGLVFESKNERELINPGESLFKWTKYQV